MKIRVYSYDNYHWNKLVDNNDNNLFNWVVVYNKKIIFAETTIGQLIIYDNKEYNNDFYETSIFNIKVRNINNIFFV